MAGLHPRPLPAARRAWRPAWLGRCGSMAVLWSHMVCAVTVLACMSATARAAAPDVPVEEVGLISALVMLGFLLLAALVVVSFVCKLIILSGALPRARSSRLRRVVTALAGVTGELRVVSSERAKGGGPRTPTGGGSAGGAGASGDF